MSGRSRRAGSFLLKVLCAPFPARVTDEEMGDALERIEALARERRSVAFFAKTTIIMTSALFGIALNSLRQLRPSWTRRRRRSHD
jgi:hypothetical protein